MQLTFAERRRLELLRNWHRRPPTWAALLPRTIALIAVWCVLILGSAALMAGVGSPFIYYSLGLVTFFPIWALTLMASSVLRWRVNETIINWDQIDSMLSAPEQGQK
jgi:hypothetical protein